MPRLKRRYEYRETGVARAFDEAVPIMVITLLVAGCIIGLSALIFDGVVDDHRQQNAARERLMSYINQPTLDGATAGQKAGRMLEMDNRNMDTDINPSVGFDPDSDKNSGTSISEKADVINLLREVVRTNGQLVLDVPVFDWSGWLIFLWIVMGLMILVDMAALFIKYAFWAEVRDWYLVDLPWRSVWPVGFILITMLPIGWGFYLVSAVRFILAVKQGATRDDEQQDGNFRIGVVDVNEAPGTAYLYGDWGNPFYEQDAMAFHRDDSFGVRPIFTNAPKTAKAHYIEMRSHGWARIRAERLQRLEDRKVNIESELKDYGAAIKKLQTERGSVNADLRLVREAADKAEKPDGSLLGAEFDRLIALPGVKAVRVFNDSISLLVEARITYKKTRYDIGDFELRFGGSGGLYTAQLRSGARPDWSGYPVYSGSGFCYGNRDSVIREHIRKGQFLEAIELAVNSLQSVNDEHKKNIPSAFYEDKEVTNERKSAPTPA